MAVEKGESVVIGGGHLLCSLVSWSSRVIGERRRKKRASEENHFLALTAFITSKPTRTRIHQHSQLLLNLHRPLPTAINNKCVKSTSIQDASRRSLLPLVLPLACLKIPQKTSNAVNRHSPSVQHLVPARPAPSPRRRQVPQVTRRARLEDADQAATLDEEEEEEEEEAGDGQARVDGKPNETGIATLPPRTWNCTSRCSSRTRPS